MTQPLRQGPDRRTYLGGPAVAAIVGVSPYLAPIDVWRFARGLDEGPDVTERMRLGLLLEQAIADAYSADTGRKVRRVGFVGHKSHAFLGGHPDRLILGEPGILEAKAAVTRRGYSDEEVPPHVAVQCQWYMGLTGRQWTDVALLASMGLTIIRVEFDPELYAALEEAAIRFWLDHVLAGVEPPPDGTEAYRRHLREKYPRSAEVELVATPEQQILLDELRAADLALKDAKRHADELENRVIAAMGEAAVLLAPGMKFTYRTEKARVRWQQVAQAIAVEWQPLMAASLIAEYAAKDTEGRDGPRVPRKSWSREERAKGAAA